MWQLCRASIVVAATTVASIASAQSPTAIIEQVDSGQNGVDVMDYVTAGRIIRLPPNGTIVIGYFRSCLQETITGGTITIGTLQSEVTGGTTSRVRVLCDGGRLDATTTQGSPGMVFRDPPHGSRKSVSRRRIFGSVPLLEARQSGLLTIIRIDQTGEHHEIRIAKEDLSHGGFIDLSARGIDLKPGGTYRAQLGGAEAVFTVDVGAKTGSVPLLSRLVRLTPPR